MLLTFEQMLIMKSYNRKTRQFEARGDLTDEQKEELRGIDEQCLEIDNRHLISNYEILKNN